MSKSIDKNLKTIGEYLFKNGQISARLKDQIFLTEAKTGKQLKYGQLEDQSHSLAIAMLREFDFQSNDICAIMSESCIEYTIIINACLLLNVPYTLIAPVIGPFFIGERLDQTKSKCLFISNEYYFKLEQMYRQSKWQHLRDYVKIVVINYDQTFDDDKQYNSTTIKFDELISKFKNEKISTIPYYGNNESSIDDLVTIIFTSGSTGRPKGACHTHRTLLTNVIEMKSVETLAKYSHQTMLLTFPLGHVSGNCLLFVALISQTPIVLLNYNEMDRIFDVIEKYRCVQVFGSANIVNLLAKSDLTSHRDISSVKMVLTAGCKLSTSTAEILAKKHGIQILDAYGCTECLYISIGVSSQNVGKPLPSFQLKLIDNLTKNELTNSSSEQLGEISIRGTSRFREYYGRPDETKKAIDNDGWFHTGDVGFIDNNGCLHITDRIKEIIKYKGWSVFPAEIELFLMTHDDVIGVVVVGVKHIEYNEVPRAYVTVKSESSITEEQLHQFVNDNLGYHQRLIGGLLIVDQLHYNQMGKIDRRFYKDLCANEILDNND
ncbi:putative 4-coumarate--CoA ligase 2 [Dermatophagoides farinae]|uniref:putative 4-coumarate--CoA ligase 2 n=1 Tax=Dermatophagoides farinae TaxID=6954 RepID=UPI003F61248E